jgi:acetyl esterase/lipase
MIIRNERLPVINTSHIKRKLLDIPYAKQSVSQKLDIYFPDNLSANLLPVIISIHGGAFMYGNKEDLRQEPMLKGIYHGYAVVSIDYRLSGEALFPALIFDCKAAVRFIRAKADIFGFAPDRIGVWGPSAGGYLAAMLGTSANVPELEDLTMGNESLSCAVQAVVDWCGPNADFLTMDDEIRLNTIGDPIHSNEDSPESRLMGCRIQDIPDKIRLASPMTYIHKDIPPFLIQHGAADPIIPVQQSVRFAEAIAVIAGRQRVQLDIIKGMGHHCDLRYETDQNINRVFNFFDKYLK